MKSITVLFAAIISITSVFAGDFNYTMTEYAGSAMPYSIPLARAAYPDTLKPVMISHVGRHGARYPSSDARAMKLKSALLKADSLGSITPVGRKLLSIVDDVLTMCEGRWGMLDSLGMAEQEGIARRMYRSFPELFVRGRVTAMASYVPRCVMSMDAFTHQLAIEHRRMNIYTESGPVTSRLLRPFEVDSSYVRYREREPYHDIYERFFDDNAPVTPAVRALGDGCCATEKQLRDFALTEYGFLSSLGAMSYNVDIAEFMTEEEYSRLWSCNNLSQYLTRTASTVSKLPADIAFPLLGEIINSIDSVITGHNDAYVQLRFGHAETLMPLLSLMHLPGCYYMTDDFSLVSRHWCNFHVVPMASNLQLILFRSDSGRMYLRTDLNEVPVDLLAGSEEVYVPWEKARKYLVDCLPGRMLGD